MLAALTCLMIMGLLLNAAVGLLERAVRRRLS
jgi:ABC-type nitrate/sulfonate/bicarbonate transport system permease component